MSRKFGQRCFQLEANVNVIGIVLVQGVDDIYLYHAKLCSNVLESWWVERLQELDNVPNGRLVPELDANHECVQLLPFRHLREDGWNR